MKALDKGVLNQFASWVRAGIGRGVMLFVASTILSALGHGADGIQEAEKRAAIPRPVAVVQKNRDNYRVIRERNRFVTDLVDDLARTVIRLAR